MCMNCAPDTDLCIMDLEKLGITMVQDDYSYELNKAGFLIKD